MQEHGGRKNGHYSRKLETASGQVGLAIPRDRCPSLLQPYARRLVDVGEVATAHAAQGGRGAAAALRDAPHPLSVPSPTGSCRRQGNSGKGSCRRSWPWSTWMGCCSRCWVRRGWSALRSTWPWGSLRRGNGRCGRTPSGRAKPVHPAGLPALAQRERQVLQGLWHRGLKRVLLFITDGLVGLPPARGSTRWLNGHAAWCMGCAAAFPRCGCGIEGRWPKTCGGCTGRRRWGL